MHIGILGGLWRYPVKSLAGEALDEVCIERDGLAGDRTRALVVSTPDHARSGKPLRGKEHARFHTFRSTDDAADAALAAGVTVDLAEGERFFDAQPVSLVVDLWIRDVEHLVGRPLDPLRWRANLYVDAPPAFDVREAALVGANLGIGDAVLRVVSTIGRCVTTTYDLASGESDPAVLREVAQHRANTLGVYCTVVRTGRAARGDEVVTL